MLQAKYTRITALAVFNNKLIAQVEIFLEVHQDQDVDQGFIGYVHPLENWVIGGSINYLWVKGIEKRIDASENSIGSFKTSDLAFGLSAGKKLRWHNIGVGGTIKYLQEDLDLKTAKTFGLDIGGFYHYNDNWSFGISLSNLGKKIKFINEGCNLPLILRVGGACKYGNWTFVGDIDRESSRENNPKFHLGTEWQVREPFAIRVGYKNGELGNWSLGCGCKMKNEMGNFNIDCAVVPYGDLGDTYRVSVAWRFGEISPPVIITPTPTPKPESGTITTPLLPPIPTKPGTITPPTPPEPEKDSLDSQIEAIIKEAKPGMFHFLILHLYIGIGI